MDSNRPEHTTAEDTQPNPATPVASDVTEVDAEPLGDEIEYLPFIPPDRRLSWLGWGVAIGIFILNKKIGMVIFILLIIFGKFPKLNLRNLTENAGRFIRNKRS